MGPADDSPLRRPPSMASAFSEDELAIASLQAQLLKTRDELSFALHLKGSSSSSLADRDAEGGTAADADEADVARRVLVLEGHGRGRELALLPLDVDLLLDLADGDVLALALRERPPALRQAQARVLRADVDEDAGLVREGTQSTRQGRDWWWRWGMRMAGDP